MKEKVIIIAEAGVNHNGDISTAKKLIDVAAESCCKVNTILIANIDGSSAADVTIEVSNDNGSTYYKLASTISVPADSTLSFLENPIYLDETDLLAVTAGAANDLSFFCSFEEIID